MWKKTRATLTSPVFIVLVAFVFRAAIVYSHDISARLPILDRIPFGYETGSVAASIAMGKGFSSPLGVESGPTAWFTPVYPYLVALVFKIFGVFTHSSLIVLLTLNSLFSALTCWPIFSIADRLAGRSIAPWTAWAWVFLPTATKFPVEWVWDTSLSALLLAFICLATLKVAEHHDLRSWLSYGGLWAFGAMTNPALITLLPFFAGWAVLSTTLDSGIRVRLALAGSLTFLLVCSPWFIRNYEAFGQFVFFRSNYGLELWLGNNELVPDVWTPSMHPNENDAERRQFIQLGEITYMAEKKRLAIDFIRNHPADFAEFVLFRFMNTWTDAWGPPAQVFLHSTWIARLGLLWNSVFSLLSFTGVFLASRSRQRGSPLFASALLVFPLTYYLTHTALRYRHPIDPLMTILCVYALASGIAFVARKRFLAPETLGAPQT